MQNLILRYVLAVIILINPISVVFAQKPAVSNQGQKISRQDISKEKTTNQIISEGTAAKVSFECTDLIVKKEDRMTGQVLTQSKEIIIPPREKFGVSWSKVKLEDNNGYSYMMTIILVESRVFL